MGIYNLISFVGMFVLMGIAWACSTNRRLVNWRVILWGTGLQLAFAAFIFAVPAGQTVFLFINGLVVKLVEVAGNAGEGRQQDKHVKCQYRRCGIAHHRRHDGA